MKTAKISASLGALALLVTSVTSAATLTVTPDQLTPYNIGQTITLTLVASGFTEPVGGITMFLASNANVSFQTGALPTGATDPLRAGAGTFLVNNNPQFDWLPGAEIPNGTFNVGTFTFLANAPGAAGIVFSDDFGGASGWFSNNTAEAIFVDYSNANVSVVPAPATLGLLASGLVGLMVRSAARRKRATA